METQEVEGNGPGGVLCGQIGERGVGISREPPSFLKWGMEKGEGGWPPGCELPAQVNSKAHLTPALQERAFQGCQSAIPGLLMEERLVTFPRTK